MHHLKGATAPGLQQDIADVGACYERV